MKGNDVLRAARRSRSDEFYTHLADIEAELPRYRDQFRDKAVYCNCDDVGQSEFWRFFEGVFRPWGLERLMAVGYRPGGTSSLYTLGRDGTLMETPLACDGDFRSAPCIKILEQADIVVTNPPFSLFREYVAQLMDYNKKFLVIGNMNAVTYRDFFPLVRDDRVWMGHSIHAGDREFRVPDDYELNAAGWRVDGLGRKYIRVKGVRWFTNLDTAERHVPLELTARYAGNEGKYPRYDNYDAINVDRTAEIPCDYFGTMGVPISFLDKYCPDQFEILGDSRYHDGQAFADDINYINGRLLYRRILIRRK